MKVVKLGYHIPSQNQIISYSSGIRPYRIEGIRLQKQQVSGKTIYHNYGHGGGGISLGWGCAKYIVQDLFLKSPEINKQQPVAILGAGIVGISTALQLIEQGFKVNLYANNFAYNTRTNQPQITTTVAAGLWMPVKISAKRPLKDLSLDTLDHLKKVLKTQKQDNVQLGISEMNCYIVNDKQGEMYSTIKGVIPYQHIHVTFDGVEKLDAIVFRTLVIESALYIPYLLNKLNKSSSFNLIQHHFQSQQQLFQIKQKSIFNCLGLAGNKFFSDPSPMKPLKGHVVKMKPSPQIMDFILFLKTESRFILQVPHQQKNVLNLGISFQEGNSNPFPEKQQVDLIVREAKEYFTGVDGRKMQQAKL